MTGYYEWVEVPDGKNPYFIHHPDGDLLHAADLTTAKKADHGWDVTFTIITREARDAGGEVPARRPAFLTSDTINDWLTPGKLDSTEKDHMLETLRGASDTVSGQLRTHRVDRAVNNVRTLTRTDPTLIEAID